MVEGECGCECECGCVDGLVVEGGMDVDVVGRSCGSQLSKSPC